MDRNFGFQLCRQFEFGAQLPEPLISIEIKVRRIKAPLPVEIQIVEVSIE